MSGRLLRYPRLFAYFVRFSVSRSLEFRLDFWFRIVMDMIYYAVNLAFFRILFAQTATLGGWTEPQAMVFVSTFLMVDALNMSLFSNNTWWIPVFINRGDLDYYLVRPVSSFFFLSARDFAANSAVNLLMTAGIMAWALGRYPEPIGAGRLLAFLAMIPVGTLLFHFIHMLVIIPCFWMHSNRGLEVIFYNLNKISERPDRIFTGPVRMVFTYALPFLLISSFPARVLIEGPAPALLARIVATTALFGFLAVGFWRLGLRNYSSASS